VTAPSGRRPPPPNRQGGSWLTVLLALLLITLLMAAGVALFARYQLSPVKNQSTPTEFEVMPGWGASRTARELEAQGLIRNARIFTLWLRFQDLDRSIGEGLFDLDPAMSTQELAASLARGGRPRTVRVVIPEGFRARDIATRLAEAGLGSREAFLEIIDAPGELRPPYLPTDAGLEGYLFPASYDVPVKSTPEEIIGQLLRRFEQEITATTTAAVQARNLSVQAWVTLASIIQAEAGNEEEMPIIAGVFLNRLELGMPLQSDPTVAYGLGKDLPELSAVAGDFERDHPWNTYTRPGLPKGPIDNPGAHALQAVLEPNRRNDRGEDYLYFLHGLDDGQPVFRPNVSLEGHNEDVRRYLR